MKNIRFTRANAYASPGSRPLPVSSSCITHGKLPTVYTHGNASLPLLQRLQEPCVGDSLQQKRKTHVYAEPHTQGHTKSLHKTRFYSTAAWPLVIAATLFVSAPPQALTTPRSSASSEKFITLTEASKCEDAEERRACGRCWGLHVSQRNERAAYCCLHRALNSHLLWIFCG